MALDDARERARRVRMVVFDVDGVLTDGSLFFGDDGQEYKAFNSLDGHGMKMLKSTGVELAIITGRTSQVVVHRALNLGITHLYQGADNKQIAFAELLEKSGLRAEAVAYVGDDVVDLPIMVRCGLAITVPAAPPLVKTHAHYVTTREGGRGAAREVCELVMDAQGTLAPHLSGYLD